MSRYELSITQLHCYETESWFGADDCRLHVHIDGQKVEKFGPWSLNDNSGLTLSIARIFTSEIILQLYDEDSSSGDDLLGQHSVPTAEGSGSCRFTLDGANYELWYHIAELQPPAPTMPWEHIDEAALLAEISETKETPHIINQMTTDLCGPAAIAYELARRFPDEYERICLELFRTGQVSAKYVNIEPDSSLYSSSVPANMRSVDWMLLATMRSAENDMLGYYEGVSGISGITLPIEIVNWSAQLLDRWSPRFESTFFYGEFDAMRAARDIIAGGGVAFLLIDAAMIAPGLAGGIAIPNHWITCIGDIELTDDGWWDAGAISFSYYSWGETGHVSLSEGDFEDHMFGAVLA